MKKRNWRITATLIALAAFLGAGTKVLREGGDLVAAFRDLRAVVCPPLCSVDNVTVTPHSLTFPAGIKGKIQIHKDKSRYGVYFLGRLSEAVGTDMRRGGIKDCEESECVDFACGDGHELAKTKFETPLVRDKYTLWVDYLQDDTPGQFQTPGPLQVQVDKKSQMSVPLDCGKYPATMRISWECTRQGRQQPFCWVLIIGMAIVLAFLFYATFRGWFHEEID